MTSVLHGRADRATSTAWFEAAAPVPQPRAVDLALRALDVTIAATALLLLSPVIGLAALGIRVLSGRPVLYRGQRVGRCGRPFEIVKLRTLRPGAEERLAGLSGAALDLRAEAEVTPLGRVLRHLHIDELPQLLCVLRGDMSLVGPRPVRPAFFAELTEDIPQYWQRLVVRPGMTGLAQLRITRSTTWAEKLSHDLEWIADRSITLYISVVAATAVRVARRLTGVDRAGRAARGTG